MKVKVFKEFYDTKEKKDRKSGDIFECTPERYKEMIENGKKYCVNCRFVEEIAEEPVEEPKEKPKKEEKSKKKNKND